MSLADHAQIMARYNQGMNERILEAIDALPPERAWADLGAFFGSIMGTMNHLYVTDTTWLQRLAKFPHPFPELETVVQVDTSTWTYNTPVFSDIASFAEGRRELDRTIVAWSRRLSEVNLETPLTYHNMRGQPFRKPFGELAMQLLTHQVHHRGHVTCLLMQEGQAIDGTGFLPYVDNIPE